MRSVGKIAANVLQIADGRDLEAQNYQLKIK
jgi:hypothetical protein